MDTTKSKLLEFQLSRTDIYTRLLKINREIIEKLGEMENKKSIGDTMEAKRELEDKQKEHDFLRAEYLNIMQTGAFVFRDVKEFGIIFKRDIDDILNSKEDMLYFENFEKNYIKEYRGLTNK